MSRRFSWMAPSFLWMAMLAGSCAAGAAVDDVPPQELLPVEVRVVDPEGQPVAGAKVIPWALRSSQGHGLWRSDDQGDRGPQEVVTDSAGHVRAMYPRYRYATEHVRTTEVTISVDHPEYVYISHEFINVPPQEKGPHQVQLVRGAKLEVVPLQDGKPAKLDGLFALWSDPRSWQPGMSPTANDDGILRLPTMAVGEREVYLVRLDGERATHFSAVVPVELKADETVRETIELRPAVRIEGQLSANVPRPVEGGRIKVASLPRCARDAEVEWVTWAPVADDGTFVIDAWPATEPAQLIAVCDGFIAESGKAPDAVTNTRDPDPYWRPQVFSPDEFSEPIEVAMIAMARCDVEVVDSQGRPLAGVEVWSCPNVGWWNGGSQVYCTPLVRGERLLRIRDYLAAADKSTKPPFEATTDVRGRCQLWLPGSEQDLSAASDDYELPVDRGRRRQQVVLTPGVATEVRLVLQPKGTEYLGDWDKLAGVLFGCTGEECRRLLEDQGFRQKMSRVSELLDSASDPRDPATLGKAYAEIAAGFDELEDQEEADRWRKKSEEQAARLNLTSAKDDAAN